MATLVVVVDGANVVDVGTGSVVVEGALVVVTETALEVVVTAGAGVHPAASMATPISNAHVSRLRIPYLSLAIDY
jgi:hypothetical protein